MPEDTDPSYREILDRLRDLKESRQGIRMTPAVDPTANVLKLVEKAVERMDALRDTDDKWQERMRLNKIRYYEDLERLREKLAAAESARLNAVNQAESRRIDAIISEMKTAVALAAEKEADSRALLAQSVVTATQTATAARDSLSAALEPRITRIEQQQYQTGGKDIQRGENREQSNINRTVVLTMIGMAVGWMLTLFLAFFRQ